MNHKFPRSRGCSISLNAKVQQVSFYSISTTVDSCWGFKRCGECKLIVTRHNQYRTELSETTSYYCKNWVAGDSIQFPIILSNILFSSFKILCMKGIDDFLYRSVLHLVSKNLFFPCFLSILCEDLLTGNIDLNFSCFKQLLANLMQSFLLLTSSVSMFRSVKA